MTIIDFSKLSPSTMLGVFGFGEAFFDAISHQDVPPWLKSTASILAIVCGAGILACGKIMKDAGTQTAKLPSGEVEKVPSHETPDDPKAVPVPKQ